MYINAYTLNKVKLHPLNQFELKMNSEIIQYINNDLKINREDYSADPINKGGLK